MIQDISKNIEVINDALGWAGKFGKDSFPCEVFKDYRRKLKKISDAMSGKCSFAAYGESQVGKSYLISSLLSTPKSTFCIQNGGKSYSFIDAINPSGGNNTKKESTGVITRFCATSDNDAMREYVKVTNLSVVDIILLIADSYYNDVLIKNENVLRYDEIDRELENLSCLWADRKTVQNQITEDDIKDIYEYVGDVIGTKAAGIYQSSFCRILSPVIQYVSYDKWVDVFGLLWNNNPDLNTLFSTLVNEYRKLDFRTEIYVPFEAVLREKGSLLMISWLDTVCGNEIPDGFNDYNFYTDVYDPAGNVLAKDFHKGYLSALIGEITFHIPSEIVEGRKFLSNMDLLDFPGARARDEIKEGALEDNLKTVLRRGKVAYLFHKYSRSLKIGSLLFCHHNDQKGPSIGHDLDQWVSDNIGPDPVSRGNMLKKTNGIAPLFMICTKFNVDLTRTKNDNPDTVEKLAEHWVRFSLLTGEITRDSEWMDNWTDSPTGGHFKNVFLLRDFYWSSVNRLFDGYDDKTGSVEQALHISDDYPGYFDDLKESFLRNSFVKNHFSSPQQAWNDVATINNDGSKAIIAKMDEISDYLSKAREEMYMQQAAQIKADIMKTLAVHHESEDKEANNSRIRTIIGDIKLSLDMHVGSRPEAFGRIIDRLMIPSGDLRKISYDVLVRHTDEPAEVSQIKLIRAQCNINPEDDRQTNIKKLEDYYCNELAQIEKSFQMQGFSAEDIVSDDTEILSTVSDVIAKDIIVEWQLFINRRTKELSSILPHADEVAFILINMLSRLGVKKEISARVNAYSEIFPASALPNAVADYASLVLNNFVCTVGRHYFAPADRDTIADKASSCGLSLDVCSSEERQAAHGVSLIEALRTLDETSVLLNSNSIDMKALRKLPFWDNYKTWENDLVAGILYSSDISHVDPVANAGIRAIIEKCEPLYS